MKLTIGSKIPEGESFKFSLKGNSKILDSVNNTIIFDSLDPGTYMVRVEHIYEKSSKWLSILLFILTAVIRGVFYFVLMDIDTAWEKKIQAFILKGKLQVNIQADTVLYFSYTQSQYQSVLSQWKHPVLTVSPECPLELTYLANPSDFTFQFGRYMKKVVSMASVIGCLFLFLLYVALTRQNLMAIIFLSIFVIGLIILVIYLYVLNNRKKARLINAFLSQINKSE